MGNRIHSCVLPYIICVPYYSRGVIQTPSERVGTVSKIFVKEKNRQTPLYRCLPYSTLFNYLYIKVDILTVLFGFSDQLITMLDCLLWNTFEGLRAISDDL